MHWTPWVDYGSHADTPQGERRCPMTETPCRLAPADCPYHLQTERRSFVAYVRDVATQRP